MKTRRRLVLLLAGLAGLLAIAVVALVLVVSSRPFAEWQRDILERRFSATLGAEVTIGSLRIDPLDRFVLLENVVARTASDAPGRPLLRVESIAVRLSPRSIIARRLIFSDLEILSPEMNLGRRDGEWSWFPPERKGAGGKLDAERLSIRHGLLRVDDLDTPFDLLVEGLRLDAASPWSRRLEGAIEAKRLHLESKWFEQTDLAISSSFVLLPESVELGHLKIDGDWLSVAGDVSVGIGQDSRYSLRGSMRADLAAIELPRNPGEAGGEVLFEGGVEGHGHVWELSGSLRASSLRWKKWTLSDLQGPVRGDGERGITMGPLTAAFAGGSIQGSVQLGGPEAGGSLRAGSATFSARGCGLAAVLQSLGRPLPLQAELGATGSIAWPEAGPRAATGRMDVSALLPARPVAGPWPVEGAAALLLNGERVEIESAEAHSGSSDLVTRGSLVPATHLWDVEFSFSSGDLARAAPLVADVASSFNLHPAEWRLETASGSAVISGTARNDGGVWTAKGTFAGNDVGYRGGLWGETVGGFLLDVDRLSLTEVRATRDGFHLTLDASVDRRGGGFSFSGDTAPWAVEEALAAADLDLPIRGPASGHFEVSRTEGNLEADVKATMESGRAWGFELASASLDLSLRDDIVSLQPLTLGLGGGRMRIEGDLAPRGGEAAASVSWEGVSLDRLETSPGPPADDASSAATGKEESVSLSGVLAGVSSGSGRLVSRDRVLRFTGDVSSPDISVGGHALGAASGKLETEFHTVRLDIALPALSARVSGSVSLDAPYPARGEVTLEDADIESLAAASGGLVGEGLEGEITAHLSVNGPLADPARLRLEGTIDAADIFAGAANFRLDEAAPLLYQNGKVVLEGASLSGEGSRLKVGGWLSTADPPSIEIRCDGEMDLGVIQLLFSDVAARGDVSIHLLATGPAASPSFSGTLAVRDGHLRRFDQPISLDALSADATLEGSRIEIPKMSANAGGGFVQGRATIDLEGFLPQRIDADLRATSVTISAPKGFRATYNGPLTLTGGRGDLLLRGDLEIQQGVYTKDFDLESFSLGTRTREFAPETVDAESLASELRLDLKVRARDNLWLKNDFGDVESRADLQLGGSLARPVLEGRIVAFEGGRIRFRRVDYRLREASVDFPGPAAASPFVNMQAETRVGGYDILLRVYGSLDRLEYALSSNPSLPPNQIVSLLVTGSPYSLNSSEAGATTDVARAYLGGTLTGFIEQPLEKLLNLDAVRIDPLLLAGETDPTTRLTLGKRVSEDLMLLYSQDLGGGAGQIYALEYQVNRRLRAYAERGLTGGVGGDLRYTTHFSLGEESTPEESPQPSEGLPERTVSSVTIDGVGGQAEEQLRARLPLAPGSVYRRRKMLEGSEVIRKWLLGKGYLEGSVRATATEAEGGWAVTYAVDRGRRIEVTIQVASRSERKQIRARLEDLWSQAVFTDVLLEEAEREILSYYHARGNYTAIVSHELRDRADGSAEVVFRVDPGPQVLVGSIVISGNRDITEERIRRQMLTVPDTVFSRSLFKPGVLDDDIASIRRLYVDQGFLSVSVVQHVSLSTDGKKAHVELEIDEGPRALVGEIRLTREGGESVGDGSLSDLVSLRSGSPYSPDLAVNSEDALRSYFDRLGYPDVRVRSEIRRQGEGVDVLFEIVPGDRKVVDAIEITGNRRTSEQVIRREITLAPGQPLSAEEMRRTQQRLYRLGIFEGVDLETVPAPGQGGGWIVRIRLREADNLSFAVGAGYDSETGARGTLEVGDSNLRGRGNYLGLQTRIGAREDRVQAIFKDPRLFGHRWDSIFSSFWERQERESFEFRRVGASAQIRRQISPHVYGVVRYNLGISDVDPDFPQATLDQLDLKLSKGRTRLADTGYTLYFDNRDNPFSPSSGALLVGDVRGFSPVVGSSETFAKVFLQGTWQKKLGEKTVFATSARLAIAPAFGTTRTEGIPLVERYFAGGDSTVRGFPRDLLGSPARVNPDGSVTGGTILNGEALGGEALLIFNQELRFPIKGPVEGVVFYDAGNTYLKPGDVSLSDLRHSLGAGLRVETPIGPLRLEYGRKLDRKEGEGPGQLYISIGTAF